MTNICRICSRVILIELTGYEVNQGEVMKWQ